MSRPDLSRCLQVFRFARERHMQHSVHKSLISLALVATSILGFTEAAQAQPVGTTPNSVQPQEAAPSCGAVTISRSGTSVRFSAGSSVTRPYMGSAYGLAYVYDDYGHSWGGYNASGSGGFNFPITASRSSKQDFQVVVTDTSDNYHYCSGYYYG